MSRRRRVSCAHARGAAHRCGLVAGTGADSLSAAVRRATVYGLRVARSCFSHRIEISEFWVRTRSVVGGVSGDRSPRFNISLQSRPLEHELAARVSRRAGAAGAPARGHVHASMQESDSAPAAHLGSRALHASQSIEIQNCTQPARPTGAVGFHLCGPHGAALVCPRPALGDGSEWRAESTLLTPADCPAAIGSAERATPQHAAGGTSTVDPPH